MPCLPFATIDTSHGGSLTPFAFVITEVAGIRWSRLAPGLGHHRRQLQEVRERGRDVGRTKRKRVSDPVQQEGAAKWPDPKMPETRLGKES